MSLVSRHARKSANPTTSRPGVKREVVAAQIGRTESAVRQRRCLLGIPNPSELRTSPEWTAEEDALVLELSAKEVVARTGRTLGAVYCRRFVLRRRKRRRKR